MTVPEHERIPETVRDWQRAGKRAALATVVEIRDSAAGRDPQCPVVIRSVLQYLWSY